MRQRDYVPLARYNLFRTRDLDEARETVGRVFCPHRLTINGATSRFNAVQNHVGAGLVSLSYIDYGADVNIEPGELGSFYLIQIPLAGGAVIATGGTTVESDTRQASILNPDAHTAMTWLSGCRQLQVQISRAVLDSFARDYLGRDTGRSIAFRPAMNLSDPACGSWLRHVIAYARFIERSSGGADIARHMELYSAELLRELIDAQPSSHAHFTGSLPTGPMPRYVKRGVDYIRAHARAPLTVNQIARDCGVAGRTLQLGFRHYLGKSPMHVLREERLDRCRLELMCDARGRSVSDVAADWGFAHPGRFSQYYKQRFGESPRHTTGARQGR